jgi:HKD family nuclease
MKNTSSCRNGTETIMRLILHTPENDGQLGRTYRHAMANAVELYIVTAFLTEWDVSLKLNPGCRRFRIIAGKDFGITKKTACRAVMNWLPAGRKFQFMVADEIPRFHPKAVFWKELNGKSFAIVGSSNLTRAAFETNYEANVHCRLTLNDFVQAKRWLKFIERQSIGVSEDWLRKYCEMPPSLRRSSERMSKVKLKAASVFAFNLPKPMNTKRIVAERREQLAAYKKSERRLMSLFRKCGSKSISSDEFYRELPNHWSYRLGNRLQGPGWERQGRNSDFQILSKSFVQIMNANADDRDDIVAEEIDKLSKKGVPARRAFLSEMLCLKFPEEYPVLNNPIQKYLNHVKFRTPRGASEGARFIVLAKKLRFSLLQNVDHPARNLAELDNVIWSVYKDR